MSRKQYRYYYIIVITFLSLMPVTMMAVSAGPGRPGSKLAGPCPDLPAAITLTLDLDDVVETEHYCIRYRKGASANYSAGVVTQIDASVVAIHAENYWARYVNDFQFPGFWIDDPSEKLSIWLVRGDEPDIVTYANFGPGTGCNGKAAPGEDLIVIRTSCFLSVNGAIKNAVGHETFHHIQNGVNLGVGSGEGTWIVEGTARLMEDQVFSDMDNWAGAPSAPFSFNKEVNIFLTGGNTNQDLTTASYRAALWWKYVTEQIGTTPGEPQLGVDAILDLWTAANSADGIAAVNDLLGSKSLTFNELFQQFALANWTKDLNVVSLPDGRYYYIDEQQAGNPAPYGPINPQSAGVLTGSVTWAAETISRYGAQYYTADLTNPACPVVSVQFDKISGSGAPFYYVVTQSGQNLVTDIHYEGPSGNWGGDWSQSFATPGLTRVTAIAGSLGNSMLVSVNFVCATPGLEIQSPSAGAPVFVGEFNNPGKLLAAVSVTGASGSSPVVAGLSMKNFTARINGVPATVVAGGFVQEQYWLHIQSPEQAANGVYDLEIILNNPATGMAIAADTNPSSVVYDDSRGDQVLVIDRSFSMADDGKMEAVQDAASFYIDVTRTDDGLSVVPFRGVVEPAPFAMNSVTAQVRQDAHEYISQLSPNGNTSIGAGLEEAANQVNTSPTGNDRCLLVLLSDGMENTAPFWADVSDYVLATGCPIMSVAFGPGSDETLLQAIAAATGGLSFYNDVFVSSGLSLQSVDDMALNLGDTYEFVQSRSAGRQRYLSESGIIPTAMNVQVHPFAVDSGTTELFLGLDWNNAAAVMEFQLRRPNGTVLDLSTLPTFFFDPSSSHMGAYLAAPARGNYELLVKFTEPTFVFDLPYRVYVGGRSDLTLELLLPDRTGGSYLTGDALPIFAFLSNRQEPLDAEMVADVTLPDGQTVSLPLFDDGLHDDGTANNGLYGNRFTRVTQASGLKPSPEGVPDPKPLQAGGYRVVVTARGSGLNRQALGSFAVLAGPDLDGDRLPDNWEEEHGVGDPTGDPDLDGLITGEEFLNGTHPNDSDTDDGGQNDGSEVLLSGTDPLRPGDDLLAAPDFFEAIALDSGVLLHYGLPQGATGAFFFRAISPDGPWDGPVKVISPTLSNYMTDTVPVPNQTFYYRFVATALAPARPTASAAVGGREIESASLASEPVTPRRDPVPPEAHIAINGHAAETNNLDVTLTFYAGHGEMAVFFEDIVEMQISNDPYLAGAPWRPFRVVTPWRLELPVAGGVTRVYGRFRDKAGNISRFTAVDDILYRPAAEFRLFLPAVMVR